MIPSGSSVETPVDPTANDAINTAEKDLALLA